MNKYYIKICECGRIHFFDNETITDICNNDNSVVCICNNCGNTQMIWFDDCMDGKAWCSRTIKNENINTDVYSVKEILTSQGFKVPMISGGFATSYIGNTFIDWDTKSCTKNERETVDVKCLINMIKDTNKLNELSDLMLNISWKGIEFENKYNK